MSFADIWQQAGEEDWEPPAGGYEVKIISGGADTTQDGTPKAKLILEVIKGPYTGRTFEHFMWMGSPVAARISKESLVMYGVDYGRVREAGDAGLDVLDDEIGKLMGTRAEITVKHKDGYVNITVSRAFTGETDVPAQAEMFQHTPAGARNAIHGDDEVPY